MPLVKQLQVESCCSSIFGNCPEVMLCLADGWEAKTKSGYPLARARIVGVGFKCKPGADCCPKLTAGNTLYGKPPTKGDFTCVYTVEIDREEEFLIDPATAPDDLPYDILPEDIVNIAPYVCHWEALMDAIDGLADWVVDQDNVVTTVDEIGKIFTVTVPIIDRNTGDNKGDFTLDLSPLFDDTFSTLTVDEPNATITFTPPVGAPTVIDVCELIEPCFDGVTITKTANSNTQYEVNFPPQGTDSLDAYGTSIPNGHTHVAKDGSSQTIQIVSETAGNVATYDDGVYVDCAAVNACIPEGPAIAQFSDSVTGSGPNPPPLTVTVVNPSSTRTARVTGGYVAAFNYNAPSGSAGGPVVNLALNGAPSIAIAQMPASPVGGSEIGGTFLTSDFVDGSFATIPPGGSVSYTLDYDVTLNGGTISSFAISLRLTAIAI